jgi:hypothetical protein
MGSLAIHPAPELRELQAPDGLEWWSCMPTRFISAHGWIARSVLSRKGSWHLGEMIAGQHAARVA